VDWNVLGSLEGDKEEVVEVFTEDKRVNFIDQVIDD
jgi:hypothetical protein